MNRATKNMSQCDRILAHLKEHGTIDPLTASGVRALIAGAQGIPVTWNDLPDLSMVDASIEPLALIFHDPGIDTSGINWNWTPA